MRLVGFGGNEADDGHEHQAGKHTERAGVDGRLQDNREAGADKDVGEHDDGGEDKADPDGEDRRAAPVQADTDGDREKDDEHRKLNQQIHDEHLLFKP